MNRILVLGLLVGILLPSGASALTTTVSTDGEALVNTLLGSDVTIVPGSVTLVGGAVSSGTFAGGKSSGLGFDSGVILTTGDVGLAPGPNNLDAAGHAWFGAGDSDLGLLSLDATVIEFDFFSDTGELYFNFQFASEEYNEEVYLGFNDTFGLYLDGVNIALVPGTTDEVSIETINGGNPFGSGNASNSHLYVNNDITDGGPFYDIQYDGFTVGLTASALGLGTGQHHMKLVIADILDYGWDSAVFLQANTFSGVPTPIPEPSAPILYALGFTVVAGAVRRPRTRADRAPGTSIS